MGRKRLFRRLDHAAIFLMIAGHLHAVRPGRDRRGLGGIGLLAFVWAVAVGGMAVKLLALRRPSGSRCAYLLLGWSVVVALGPLVRRGAPAALLLLVAGGVLYSVGVVFHLWLSLAYHNAIWHGFVLAGAVCHWGAIVREVATA